MEKFSKEKALQLFKQRLRTFADAPEEDLNQFANVMQIKHFNKGEVILKEGQVCRHFYFILQGCIRSFRMKDGREVNTNFYFEEDIASDFISLRDETPSKFYLVALEECIVYCGSKKEASPVFLNEMSLHAILFRFFQALYFKQMEHSNGFRLLDPEERYKYMLERNPQYLQRIPLSYLASYLGMSRETLSRIRKKRS
ncbi:Crp/Fnr family transcriptional regulator [Parafilimonas sp.]|uniref:Crp/Fnr family transcriptional regulator n=1 Tax=Parafilimonas sp. TaxID=1969739 RepID=UPI003F801E86